MKSLVVLIGQWVAVALLSMRVLAAEGPRLTPGSVAAFASLEQGRSILTNRDEFILALSRFDRAARMKTDRDVPEVEFLEYLGGQVRSWTPDETNKLTTVCRRVARKLDGWSLPLPPVVLFIKTTGAEEGQAAYTRQSAVVVPQRRVRDPEFSLEALILHELLHVATRHRPELRERLYRIIGFTPINSVDYPEDLRDRRITNPDGFQTGWLITLTNRGQALPSIPILYASQSRYNPTRGGEFFEYLVFKLMVVTNDNGHWQPLLADGKPRLLEAQEIESFLDQVGRNTEYVIHPDEVLAENLGKLLNGETNVPSPHVIEGMADVLQPKDRAGGTRL
jgi:hypothetical protein